MRADDIENKMYELFNKIDFAYNEQDCFNYIGKGKKKVLSAQEAILVIKNYIIDAMPGNIKQEYLDNLKNTTPLIVHLIKKPWLLPEEYVPYADMFNEIRKQTPYKYHRHKKEIFKFKMSSKMKYLYIFSKKIFDSRKDINKYMERIAK